MVLRHTERAHYLVLEPEVCPHGRAGDPVGVDHVDLERVGPPALVGQLVQVLQAQPVLLAWKELMKTATDTRYQIVDGFLVDSR